MRRCYGCFMEYSEGLDICPHCGYEDGDSPNEALHLEPGRILKNTYVIGRVLGYGGFGVTYLAWNAVLELKVAIKEYLPSEFSTRMLGQTEVTVFNGDKSEQFHDGVDKFVEEANQLARFRNTDGIVRINESFKENNTAYIVMEYLDGETLTKYLEKAGQLSADEAVRLMTPIIKSLQIVHDKDIIHRDIAPDNIMVTKDGQVKLIDFGAARYATTTHSRSLTVVIKPGYSPEEQYRSRGDQGSWTDVYAVGATMYRMITGQIPPDAMERRAFFEGKKKDILIPLKKYAKQINQNQEVAILNAMNVRIEDRTQNMSVFSEELNSENEVKRRYGKIKKIDVLKWPLWTKITIPVAACLVIVLSTLFATGVIGFNLNLQEAATVPEGMAKVPSIVSNGLEKAELRVEKAGLIFKIMNRLESDDIADGLILSQDLSAGSLVAINSEIKVVISAGKKLTDEELLKKDKNGQLGVVDAQFRTKEDAVALLQKQGMVVKIVEQSSETVEAGVVISQNPLGGTRANPGTEITLVISTGGASFNIPNVVGQTEATAKSTLSGVGLTVNVEYIENDNSAGSVISQNPSAGTKAKKGDTVTIKVAVKVNKGQCTVSFNANGGSVSASSAIVNVGGSVTSALPVPVRDNHNFLGWYTAASGGNQFTGSSVVSGNMTVYAQWRLKDVVTAWTQVGAMPAGAMAVNHKWTYSHTQASTSSTKPSGYNYVRTSYSAWSGWSGWENRGIDVVRNPYDGELITDVQAQYINPVGHIEWHYCRWTSTGIDGWTWKKDANYRFEETWTTYEVPMSSDNVSVRIGGQVWIPAGNSLGTWSDKTPTRWVEDSPGYWQNRYNTRTATYYYQRNNIEASSYPSGSGISNVVEYVQYIPK